VTIQRQSLCVACGNEFAPPGQLRCEECQTQWERSQAAMRLAKACARLRDVMLTAEFEKGRIQRVNGPPRFVRESLRIGMAQYAPGDWTKAP
jgi:hypothetical protein